MLKGLKKENLRDNMTNMELILSMLAEASTKDISTATNPENFKESKKVARQGGNVAKVARKELEANTGKKVVSSNVHFPNGNRKQFFVIKASFNSVYSASGFKSIGFINCLPTL